LEEHVASIFRVEKQAKQETSMKQAASKAGLCKIGGQNFSALYEIMDLSISVV
jgi:hypothetical protein